MKLYLSRTQAEDADVRPALAYPANVRAFVASIVRQGVLSRQRWSYWKFLMTVATRYRHCVGAAMTLAVMGYHFQVMTDRLCKAVRISDPISSTERGLPTATGQTP